MPRLDKFHNEVRNALRKDGWTITDDPLVLNIGDTYLYIDLGAEKFFDDVMFAERQDRRIAIEIKVFNAPSPMDELGSATGQYVIYRTFLEESDPERTLFLAIPQNVYQTIFQRTSFQKVLKRNDMYILVFDPDTEEVVAWLE